MASSFSHFVNQVEDRLMWLGETVLERLPRPFVAPEKFKNLRVIAHRGSHLGTASLGLAGHKENTLAAFDHAVALGAWGIEFDVRFTACGEPVIHHDEHTLRVFARKLSISETSFSRLRAELALIPTLDEIVARYGRRVHLMIELKTSVSECQSARLKDALKSLEPGADYHFMSLKSARLKQILFTPPEALLPIAEFDAPWVSREALRQGWAGLAGQYFLISPKQIASHHAAQQLVGTGFVNTPAALRRELSRGVNWIFTDQLDAILKHAADQQPQAHAPVGHIS